MKRHRLFWLQSLLRQSTVVTEANLETAFEEDSPEGARAGLRFALPILLLTRSRFPFIQRTELK